MFFAIFRKKRFQGDSYPVTNNIRSFCKRVAKEGRAGIEFVLAEGERVSKEIYSISGKYMANSPYRGRAFDQTTVCSTCLSPIPKYVSLPRQCPSCGGTRGINLYNCTDPVITKNDIGHIRDFFRAKAKEWWTSQAQHTAKCDRCDGNVGRKDGYLYGNRLLCPACCEKVVSAIDDTRKRGGSMDDPGLLRLARKHHETGILGPY